LQLDIAILPYKSTVFVYAIFSMRLAGFAGKRGGKQNRRLLRRSKIADLGRTAREAAQPG
jgi:hypothetical protein